MTALDYRPPPPLAPAADRGIPWDRIVKAVGPLIGLVFVFALFTVLVDVIGVNTKNPAARFLKWDNVQIMLLQTAVVGTAALGMTIVIISGGIDLSVGSAIAMVTMVVALLLNAGAPSVVAAAGGVAGGLLVGLGIGSLITGLRLSPFIVTLGLWGAIRGAAKGVGNNSTIVPHRETWMNALLSFLGPDQKWMIFPPGVWVTLLLAVVVACLLRYTKFGRHVFAVGSNEQTARLCGVGVNRTKLMLYATAGVFTGVAGILQFSYLGQGDPTTANGMELDVIAAVVIGGASLSGGEGNVWGSLIGALLMTAVANGCQKVGFENWVQQIVTGGIIIAAAAIDRLRHRPAT